MVDSVRPSGLTGIPRSTGQSRREPSAGFSVETGAEAATGHAPVSGAPAIGFESMLMLQAVDEAQERDQRARRRGIAMIAALTDLQRALLAAEDPALALRSLSELAADGPLAADPALAAILRATVLRARVEVARRERRDA